MGSNSTLDVRKTHPYKVAEVLRERQKGIKSQWTTSKIKRKIFPGTDKPDEIVSILIFTK